MKEKPNLHISQIKKITLDYTDAFGVVGDYGLSIYTLDGEKVFFRGKREILSNLNCLQEEVPLICQKIKEILSDNDYFICDGIVVIYDINKGVKLEPAASSEAKEKKPCKD